MGVGLGILFPQGRLQGTAVVAGLGGPTPTLRFCGVDAGEGFPRTQSQDSFHVAIFQDPLQGLVGQDNLPVLVDDGGHQRHGVQDVAHQRILSQGLVLPGDFLGGTAFGADREVLYLDCGHVHALVGWVAGCS